MLDGMKMGRFIAGKRKALAMTQQLYRRRNRGKSLPDYTNRALRGNLS